MKILNPILFVLAVISITGLRAQDDVDCQRELQFLHQSAKIKEYDTALEHYNALLNGCEAPLHVSVYQYGNIILNHFIDQADTAEEKKKYAEAYIENYSSLREHYPERIKGNFYTQIAQMKLDNNIGTLEEQFEDFDKAWKEDRDSFTDPKALYSYFSLLIDLQDEGKRTLEDSFMKYDEVMEKIEEEEAKRADEDLTLREKKENGEELTQDEKTTLNNAGIYLSNYMRIKESIDIKIGTRADCENLIPLYTRNFEEKKTDSEWLKLAAKRLSEKKCTDGDLFVNITEALHDLEPSAKSAKYLGQLAAHKNQMNRALEYYKESAELESKNLDKAKVYYLIANIYNKQGQLAQARTYYQRTLRNNPALGNAHLQIASMYAKSVNNCGDSDFNKRAVYWLAEREARAAGRVDPSIRKTAEQTAEAYKGRAPSAKDIFNEDMAGKTVQVGCWINESVKVPSL